MPKRTMRRANILATPLERGDLRLLILNLLKEPMHGYQIMCKFKEGSHGHYKPSTGALYPQLKSLEDDCLINSSEEEGRRCYTVTKRGEQYLKENRKWVSEAMKRFHDFWEDNELGEFTELLASITKTIMAGAVNSLERENVDNSKRIRESKNVLKKTEAELKAIWT